MLSKWEIRYLIILTCVMMALVTLVLTNFYLRTQLNDVRNMLETIHAEHHQLYFNLKNDKK